MPWIPCFSVLLLLGVLGAPLCAGLLGVVLFGRRTRQQAPLPSLLFHSVSSARMNHFSYITRDRLESLFERFKQLELQGTSIRERLHSPRASRDIALTFDDGFEDFYHNAFPALTKFGFHASVFPVVDCIGKKSDWDVFGSRTHLSWAQLKEIANAGHEIGSHGLSHADMTLLPRTELQRELVDSKARLEDSLGCEISAFSFPFGSWNQRVWQAAQEAGYKACTVYRSIANTRPPVFGVNGVYAFDSIDDILCRLFCRTTFTNAVARGRVMPHFAKGSPLWRFRRQYTLPFCFPLNRRAQ